jgi:proteasome lid subunit RPN8/RPN11
MDEPATESPLDCCEIRIHSAEPVDKPVAGLPYAAPVEIIVDATAWSQITTHACEDLRNEVGGMMLGEIYEHAGRGAVRITAAVPARGAVNALASIQFTHDAWSEMERLRRSHSSGEKLVGWYHTHPGFTAFFSATDTFMHERFFTQPWHVALVLDPVQGEHRFYRWEGGKVKASPEFLLQRSAWQDPQAPLRLVLGNSLRRTAEELELAPENGGAVVAPAMRRLAASLPSAPAEGASDTLLPLLVACAEIPADVVAAARQLVQRETTAGRPLHLADLECPSANHNPRGALAIAFGWLVQLSDPRHVHVHCLEGPRLCRTLALPVAAHGLACDERGNLLLLTRDARAPLRLLRPPLPALRPGAEDSSVPEARPALLPLDIDWGDLRPATRIGRIERGRRHLYLLTRGEIFVLSCPDPGRPWRFQADAVHPAAACGWDSFTKLTDWAVDIADNLFLLMRSSREVWRFDPLHGSWKRFAAVDLDRPTHLCAGLTTLWVYDEAREEVARFGIPDGAPLGRRPLGEGLRGHRIWGLATDGYRRLYLATEDQILCTR